MEHMGAYQVHGTFDKYFRVFFFIQFYIIYNRVANLLLPPKYEHSIHTMVKLPLLNDISQNDKQLVYENYRYFIALPLCNLR